jgi:hypothetical protein
MLILQKVKPEYDDVLYTIALTVSSHVPDDLLPGVTHGN